MSGLHSANELARLEALREYQVLDSEPEIAYDDLVALASEICGTPIAAISLMDGDRQWFKATCGLQICETPRAESICNHVVLNPNDVLVVQNAAQDDRFHHLPLVQEEPGVRFYAGAPLVNSDGFALGALCVVAFEPRDLNPHQKAALVALARQVVAQLELRKTVRQLSAQRDALEHALERANESDRAKELFLTNMNHELRTPLNGLLGMTDLLRSTELEPRQLRFVDAIRKSGEGLLELVSAVLEISERAESSVGQVRAPAHLPSLAREVTELMSSAAGARNLELTCYLDPALEQRVLTDGMRLRQALTNILSNAVKFTESGRVQLRVTAHRATRQAATVRFEVADTGIGIPEDRLESIFKPFEQADGSLSRKFGGLGLGLASSRQLVEQLGGRLQVKSRVGRGSTFSFELELDFFGASQPRKVLVVEDNEVNTLVITAMLEQKGCIVEHAENGLEALRWLENDRCDAIFMDLQMPVMDGVTATRRVRAMEAEVSQTPIIAVTASTLLEDERACREAGMNGIIRKPLSEKVLAETLERLLPNAP